MEFSVIVTTLTERPQLWETLAFLVECQPRAAEILVHVDGGNSLLASRIKEKYPSIKVSESKDRVGPGGSRNILIAASQHDWVASFDDDARPVDIDFFRRLQKSVQAYPAAAVIVCDVVEPNGVFESDEQNVRRVADYVGCGCVHRRSSFLRTSGYIPLEIAYGMEEVDHALRLMEGREQVIFDPSLRVLHSTDPSNRSSPAAVSAGIANVLLRAWLRYPLLLLPLGLFQATHRICWLLCHGSFRGIFASVPLAVCLLAQHGSERDSVSMRAVFQYHFSRRLLPKT